jgi:hypothetical protein
VTVLGLALALAPMAAASASHKTKSHHKAKHHATVKKSSKAALAPGSSLCQTVDNAQTNSSDVGSNIEKAMLSAEQSGNFDAAKPAMIAAINASLKDEGPAEAALRSAPSNVQAALKGLFTWVQSFETVVNNSQSFTQFASSIVTLTENSTIETDSDTLANYLHVQCGTPLPTTPGSSTAS